MSSRWTCRGSSRAWLDPISRIGTCFSLMSPRRSPRRCRNYRPALLLAQRAGLPRSISLPQASNATAVAARPDIDAPLDHGAVVIAAITSCTNTSNPMMLLTAGLFAAMPSRAVCDRGPG